MSTQPNDRYGNCVNIKKEFSCERNETDVIDIETVQFKPVSKNEASKLVCMNIGCIDGNCVDKTSDINNEMMDSVSKLQAASRMKDHINMSVFTGKAQHCNQHAAGYYDCCKTDGWGKYLGAKCSADEKQLSERRKQNKCVYVGKQNVKRAGVTVVTKNHWCCFSNILEKIVQVQGRQQLGQTFGSGGSPDCRGLTFDELTKINFDKIDFSEFHADILKRMKLPKIEDIDNRVKNAMPNTRKSSDQNTDSDNRKAGVNTNSEGLMNGGEYGK
jgi:hypothetical protein